MKKLGILTLCLLSPFAQANTESEIKSVVEENFRATQAEDLNATLKTIHSQSASFAPSQNALNQIFSTYDLKYSLLEFKFIAEEGGYAYARVKQLTEKITGPAFSNNELESLQIFKKENGSWKLWTQANLAVNFK
ncbi:hypothetical protein [Thalassotalea crassostreae]|uniref:hypothetical protein n=1 Tax=Thalassotalea crassostreae TaxID=1763536 RepID=UPI000838FFE5|nr:hypothetical protein [Thalassotalea crassostreae]